MSSTAPSSLVTYTVTLQTPQGVGQLDVPSTLGPDAAGRRAHIAACQLRWGDIDEIEVLSVTVA